MPTAPTLTPPSICAGAQRRARWNSTKSERTSVSHRIDTDCRKSLAQAAFGPEFKLRDFIAQNIEAIDVRGIKLELYVDPAGRDGNEYPTAVGPIDILAVDKAGGFYVFEYSS